MISREIPHVRSLVGIRDVVPSAVKKPRNRHELEFDA